MRYFPYDPIQKGYEAYANFYGKMGLGRREILRRMPEFEEDVLILLPSENKDGEGISPPELRYQILRSHFVAIDMGESVMVTKNRYDGRNGLMSRIEFERIVRLWRSQ